MSAQPTKGHRGLGRVNPSTEVIIVVILQKTRLDVETKVTQGGQEYTGPGQPAINLECYFSSCKKLFYFCFISLLARKTRLMSVN